MADMHLSAGEVKFLAARLRRLFEHFGYELPDLALDDADLIRITGTCIGDLLRRLNNDGTPVLHGESAAAQSTKGDE